MRNNRQLEYLRKIVKYAEEIGNNEINFSKLFYLTNRLAASDRQIINSDDEFEELCDKLWEIAKNSEIIRKIYYVSLLLFVRKDPVYVEYLLKLCLNGEISNPLTINFIRLRCVAMSFNYSVLTSERISDLSFLAYKKCVDGFRKMLGTELMFIPKESRNSDTVIVMTSQFLSEGHAPTKTLLARCRVLRKALGLDVEIINTREQLSMEGSTYYVNPIIPNINEEYSSLNTITYQDETYNFYQSPVPMPNLEEIFNILIRIYKKNPYYIVHIGNLGITAGLCAEIVPVLTVGTVPSSLPISLSQFVTIGRKLNEYDLDTLMKFGIEKERVIECVFTSDFRKQTESFTRASLNLPEERFLIMLVGWRLNSEIDHVFLEMISKTFSENTHLVFIGPADEIRALSEKNSELSEHCSFLGEQKDLIAIAEVCDLYVNPKRAGGGISCVEAMSKGVPVVTLSYGDVWINAGDDFVVPDYEHMAETIKRYAIDRQFYEEMSERAIRRAEVLTKTDVEFTKVIEAMLESPLFE